jgi:hypothetical protein
MFTFYAQKIKEVNDMMKTFIIALLALVLTSGAVFAAQTRAGNGQGKGTQTQTRIPGQCK